MAAKVRAANVSYHNVQSVIVGETVFGTPKAAGKEERVVICPFNLG